MLRFYMTVKEKAEAMGLEDSVVRRYCINDRFDPPAEKKGSIWFIPQDAVVKPVRKKPDSEYKLDPATREKYRIWQQRHREKKRKEQV